MLMKTISNSFLISIFHVFILILRSGDDDKLDFVVAAVFPAVADLVRIVQGVSLVKFIEGPSFQFKKQGSL